MIELKNVTKRFGWVTALDGVSLKLEENRPGGKFPAGALCAVGSYKANSSGSQSEAQEATP